MKSLKLITLSATLLVTAITGSSAFADFVQGRERAHYESEMSALKATGVYRGAKSAEVTLNFVDGASEPSSISVLLFRETLTYPIHSVKKSGCGDTYVAYPNDDSRLETTFTLIDYTHALCEIVTGLPWKLSVLQTGGIQGISKLDLEGKPEALNLSL